MPKTQTTEEPASFEEALERLETIVESLEGGDIPLADLVTKYESGTRLAKFCQRKLDQAEQKIEKLRQEDGQVSLEPFDAPADS